MKEQETYNGGSTFLVPEFEDVMEAKDLGRDHTIDDWPFGRQKKCSMHFFVESNKKGERLVKQSTLDGRSYRPKTSTYSTKVKLVEIDGMMGSVEWSKYGMFKINIESSKYSSANFHDKEAFQLFKHFFGNE